MGMQPNNPASHALAGNLNLTPSQTHSREPHLCTSDISFLANNNLSPLLTRFFQQTPPTHPVESSDPHEDAESLIGMVQLQTSALMNRHTTPETRSAVASWNRAFATHVKGLTNTYQPRIPPVFSDAEKDALETALADL
jgi:hypothetical protein